MPAKVPPSPEQPGFDLAKLYLWVKGLESKINTLLREVDVLKNDFIRKNNELRWELKTVNEELLEINHDREKVVQKMDLIIKELRQTASMDEVATLKKYIEYWNPLHFATQRDVERAIEAKIALGGEESASHSEK